MATTPFNGNEDERWDGEDELDLAEDERLPWLDAGDEEEVAAYDSSRVFMLGALALILLGVVVAAVWFVSNQASDEPEPDGSVIAAPEGPYKVRPDNPGGKTFEGTGDTSFAVGEGQTREGQLADTPTPAPAPKASASAAGPSIASTVDEGPRQPQASGFAVQVGAFPSRTEAEEAWARLIRQTEALNGVSHRVVEAQVDIGTVYRLQAVAGDRASAVGLCGRLKSDGLPCFVK